MVSRYFTGGTYFINNHWEVMACDRQWTSDRKCLVNGFFFSNKQNPKIDIVIYQACQSGFKSGFIFFKEVYLPTDTKEIILKKTVFATY